MIRIFHGDVDDGWCFFGRIVMNFARLGWFLLLLTQFGNSQVRGKLWYITAVWWIVWWSHLCVTFKLFGWKLTSIHITRWLTRGGLTPFPLELQALSWTFQGGCLAFQNRQYKSSWLRFNIHDWEGYIHYSHIAMTQPLSRWWMGIIPEPQSI